MGSMFHNVGVHRTVVHSHRLPQDRAMVHMMPLNGMGEHRGWWGPSMCMCHILHVCCLVMLVFTVVGTSDAHAGTCDSLCAQPSSRNVQL